MLSLFYARRFTTEAETDLKDPLRELGIRDMFDQSKANFAKITRELSSESFHAFLRRTICYCIVYCY